MKTRFLSVLSGTAVLTLTLGLSACDPVKIVTDIFQSDVVERVECKTTDSNNNGRFGANESSEPEFEFGFKPGVCNEAVVIDTEVCFMERRPDGIEFSSYDATGNQICGNWRHRTTCSGGTLRYESSTCTGGNYCSVTLGRTPDDPCGWQVQSFTVKKLSGGEELEFWTDEAVDDILDDFLNPDLGAQP